MRDKMEYKGLWEKDEIPDIIYKVTEFYEWHNTDPVIISTIFINKEVARRFFNQRLKEIPYEVWDNDEEYIKERVRTEEYGEDNICITNDNDYIHLFFEPDRIHLFPTTELWSGD